MGFSIKIIFSSLLFGCLVSCDPGFAVILSNQSANQKKITIDGERFFNWHQGFKDSIKIHDFRANRFDTKTYALLILSDSLPKRYSFILPTNHDAILYHGMGFAFIPNDLIIIDEKDTLTNKSWKRKIGWMYSEEKAVLK